MKFTKAQQKIIDTIKAVEADGNELSEIGGGWNKLSRRSARILVKNRVIVCKGRSRLRQDDMEMVYWTVWKLVENSEVVK
jgi:hypothetical protein